MFDIGFFELMLLAVVGLLVMGPEKLPGAIRTVSYWIRRAKQTVSGLQRELEREIGADDIRRQLKEQELSQNIHELRDSLKQQAETLNNDINSETQALNKHINQFSETNNHQSSGDSQS